MNSTTILYDNQTIQSNLTDALIFWAQSAYLVSSTRFIVYNIARCCQALIGVPANIMTLLIIKRIRFRLNMHIIMIYLAVSDILSSATIPMSIYMSASVAQIITFTDQWDSICIIKIYFDMLIFLGSFLSYVMLSIDR